MILAQGRTTILVLYQQGSHWSRVAWQDEYIDVMHCRRRKAIIQRQKDLDPRILDYLQASGFYGVSCIKFIQLD